MMTRAETRHDENNLNLKTTNLENEDESSGAEAEVDCEEAQTKDDVEEAQDAADHADKETKDLDKKTNHWYRKTPRIVMTAIRKCPIQEKNRRCVYKESGHPAATSLSKDNCEATTCHIHKKGPYKQRIILETMAIYKRRHAQSQLIAAAMDSKYKTIIIHATIKGKPIRILLDSGATGNHLQPSIAEELKIRQEETSEWVTITSVNGQTVMEGNIKRTEPTVVRSGPYITMMTFDLTPVSGFDGIFGMAWLQAQNPVIDWDTGSVAIDDKLLRTKLESYKGLASLQEESGNNPQSNEKRKVARSPEMKTSESKKKEINENPKRMRINDKRSEQDEKRRKPENTRKPKPKELNEKETESFLCHLR